jgi:hypothetical protein
MKIIMPITYDNVLWLWCDGGCCWYDNNRVTNKNSGGKVVAI